MARRPKTSDALERALDALGNVPAPAILRGREAPAQRWATLVRALGCVVCRRFAPLPGRTELHHVAEGSGLRSDFSVVPLCAEHHRGAQGLHGMSPPAFVVAYRVPGESEFGLLIWVAEDIARFRLR